MLVRNFVVVELNVFHDPQKEAFWKHSGKGEHAGNHFSVTFSLSSANAFNLDQCEILWCGKELRKQPVAWKVY